MDRHVEELGKVARAAGPRALALVGVVLALLAIAGSLAAHFAAKPGTRVRILLGLFEYEKGGALDQTSSIGVREIVAAAPFPMAFVDASDVVRYSNPQLETLLGSRELRDKDVRTVVNYFEDLVPDSRRAAFRLRQSELFGRAESEGLAAVFDAEYLTLPGGTTPTHLVALRFLNSAGEKVGTLLLWFIEPVHSFPPPA